jgi:tetratricopeptide (TPR) repeat protein
LANGYNLRCHARALPGQELDQALSDCNKAVRLMPNDSGILQNRGLVRLRMGDFDRAIADYNASLKIHPRNPWSLYGRGLAEAHKNQAAAAAGDFAAATAVVANIADDFKKHGLTP